MLKDGSAFLAVDVRGIRTGESCIQHIFNREFDLGPGTGLLTPVDDQQLFDPRKEDDSKGTSTKQQLRIFWFQTPLQRTRHFRRPVLYQGRLAESVMNSRFPDAYCF